MVLIMILALNKAPVERLLVAAKGVQPGAAGPAVSAEGVHGLLRQEQAQARDSGGSAGAAAEGRRLVAESMNLRRAGTKIRFFRQEPGRTRHLHPLEEEEGTPEQARNFDL